MNTMVPGLMGGKMSSSDPDSKIDFLDAPEAVKRKIKKAFCEEGNVAENGLLAFVKAVLIPISELRLERLRGETGEDTEEGKESTSSQKPFSADDAPEGTVFTITRDKGGGPRHYKTYQELEDDFAAKEIHPADMKAAVRDAIISFKARADTGGVLGGRGVAED
jgi:tyrosyl-tRNA synthetase